jgi:hypothetical protein
MRFLLLFLTALLLPNFAKAECLKVADDPQINMRLDRLDALKAINFERKDVFQALWDTSLYETMGCWATPVGNFDAQTLSVGVLQWNYGQNSLQKLMTGYKAQFTDDAAFQAEVSQLMPNYGAVAFSEDCLIVPTPQSCKDKIIAAHTPENKLNPTIAAEYEALFNSLKMRQTQVDVFSDYLIELTPKLQALFGDDVTPLKVKWGIDVAIQQGFLKYNDQNYYLKPDDVTTINKIFSGHDKYKQKATQLSIIRWYSGLCGGIYQGVTTEQCNYNIKTWCAVINHGLSDEQAQLLNYTYVRSRIAQGQSGRWQANAFARRTKIALNSGWVGKEKVGLPKGVRKTRKCNKWLVE